MVLTKEDLRNKRIKISSSEEWVKTQLVLFSYGIKWIDTGFNIFELDSKKRFYSIKVSEDYTMECFHSNHYNYEYKDIENM